MAKALVVVESPAKANTLKKYLGKDFQVKSSVGHVKDLPPKKLGVDIKNNFEPEYEIIKGKKKVLDELKKASQTVQFVYLAPDPDREGEAIAWHIYEDLKKIKKIKIYRVLFHEITKKAVLDAIGHPQALSLEKYQAQQARRILDRLVGYQISPILWDKVRRGLSAGRVQSVALRLVVEREHEIKAFKSEEYWSIWAKLSLDNQSFDARLAQIEGKKAEISNEAEAKKILERLQNAAFSVGSIVRREKKRNPVAPFITSTLQQEGARKLGFSAKKTMTLAQMLYEGLDVNEEGPLGLITYMRTDSTRLSNEAIGFVRDYIKHKYGNEYLPDTPNAYKTQKAAQEAHEAIRPTSIEFPPERVKPHLEKDLFRLYELIWNRFVACQMTPAILDQTALNIDVEGPNATKGLYLFRANGQVIKFPGFLAVYQEEKEEVQKKKEEEEEETGSEKQLPKVSENDVLEAKEITPKQHFTEPPPRFSEASLVKALEQNGIGRPSTYASILSNIQEREYVEKKENRFYPTELGFIITDLLVKNFPDIMNIEFTAGMEEKLDLVEEGKVNWQSMLKEFYRPFEQTLKKAKVHMKDVKREEVKTEHTCEKCGSVMVIKWGRRGKFLACSSYPDCKNTKEFVMTAAGQVKIQPKPTVNETCDKCQSPLTLKQGRFGRFLACSKYPDCKFTKPYSLGIPCAQKECGGQLVEKRSRSGKIFYSCSNYPKCTFATWYPPVHEPCPDCKAPFMVFKQSKTDGSQHVCLNPDCGYKEEVSSENVPA